MTGRPGSIAALLLGAALAACSTRATGRTIPAGATDPAGQRLIRVAIMTPDPRVGATGALTWSDALSGETLAAATAGEQWRIEREAGGGRVRAVATTGAATAWRRALRVASPHGMVTVSARRYRGTLTVVPLDTGFAVVNTLGIEDYLRGVVAVELGTRRADEIAALESQAVAARTYAFERMSASRDQPFDVRGSVADQAYGGYDVEYALANRAIDVTRGLVLRYDGRLARAVYSSTCGGTTARASEIWQMADQPYLQSVSDAIPGTERHYCDIAPRFRWVRTLSGAELDAAVAQYLAAYARGTSPGPGRTRMISVRGLTPTGRVGLLDVRTDAGVHAVRGNDSRYVLRPPGGEVLNSPYYSVEPEVAPDGALARVTVRGRGYGHGVGMCQWGAIGRARAGQTFRTILATYYPGTTVGAIQ